MKLTPKSYRLTLWLSILLIGAIYIYGVYIADPPWGDTRSPAAFLIPNGYNGVLVTIYEQPGFPALPLEDGYQLHAFPADGIIVTSSKLEYGTALDRTFEVTSDGKRLPYGSRFSATGAKGNGAPEIKYLFIAVGSDDYWQAKDAKEYDLKVNEAIHKLQRTKHE